MPHQCLSCGFSFEEGSSALLKGCPECKGTRFFYAKEAVDEAERQNIADKAQKDIRQVVADMLQEAAPEIKDLPSDGDGWAQIKPRDIRRLVSQAKAEAKKQEPAPGTPSGRDIHWEAEPEPDPEAVARAQAARQRVEQERDAARGEAPKPDTVSIDKPGSYNIDVKGLLERNPIVVHKDGAYVIHLPSLFQKKD